MARFGTLLLLVAASFGAAGQTVSVARWPGDRQAAISLTFDDSMATHLDIARPILKKHGLHGTFFVVTGNRTWQTRSEEWKALAAEGHELASHTVHHPCLLPAITPHSQDYTPEAMEAELRESVRAIVDLTGTRRGVTFAYPCGNMSFGPPADHARNAARFARYVAEHYFAARAYGNGEGRVVPDMLNILAVPDLGEATGRDSIALLSLAAPAIRERGWGVYAFHGIGGQHLSVTAETFEDLAGYLDRHQEIWTATFGDAARYIQESKAAELRTEMSEGGISVTVKWPLDPAIYDVPLTLRVELPQGWVNARAHADGRQLPARVVAGKDRKILLVDAAAGTSRLRIDRRER